MENWKSIQKQGKWLMMSMRNHKTLSCMYRPHPSAHNHISLRKRDCKEYHCAFILAIPSFLRTLQAGKLRPSGCLCYWEPAPTVSMWPTGGEGAKKKSWGPGTGRIMSQRTCGAGGGEGWFNMWLWHMLSKPRSLFSDRPRGTEAGPI